MKRTWKTDKIEEQVKAWLTSHRDYVKSEKFDADVQGSGIKTWSDWVFSAIGPNCKPMDLTDEETSRVSNDAAALVNLVANDEI